MHVMKTCGGNTYILRSLIRVAFEAAYKVDVDVDTHIVPSVGYRRPNVFKLLQFDYSLLYVSLYIPMETGVQCLNCPLSAYFHGGHHLISYTQFSYWMVKLCALYSFRAQMQIQVVGLSWRVSTIFQSPNSTNYSTNWIHVLYVLECAAFLIQSLYHYHQFHHQL